MRDGTSTRLNNLANRLKAVEQVIGPFVQHLNATGTPPDVPGRLVLEERTLRVYCLGRRADASLRSVLVDSDFAMEFTFQCDGYEVWQFYLTPGSGSEFVIKRHLADEEAICTMGDPTTAEHIIRGVAVALLTSPVLQPRSI